LPFRRQHAGKLGAVSARKSGSITGEVNKTSNKDANARRIFPLSSHDANGYLNPLPEPIVASTPQDDKSFIGILMIQWIISSLPFGGKPHLR
jgi:hypothetical protein